MNHLSNGDRIILMNTLVIEALVREIIKLSGKDIECIQLKAVRAAGKKASRMSDREKRAIIEQIKLDQAIAFHQAMNGR